MNSPIEKGARTQGFALAGIFIASGITTLGVILGAVMAAIDGWKTGLLTCVAISGTAIVLGIALAVYVAKASLKTANGVEETSTDMGQSWLQQEYLFDEIKPPAASQMPRVYRTPNIPHWDDRPYGNL